MSDLAKTLQEELQKQTETDDNIRKILMKHMELEDPNKKDNNPGYYAWGLQAVETGVALANLILSIKNPGSNRGFRAISDLTYTLNANDFWNKNSPVLVPVLTVILNAHKDWVDMTVRRKELAEYAVYDKMISGTQAICLELFSMLLYLTGGPLLINTVSLELKIDLAPYFVK